jgi:hypothetical protein
LHDGLGCLEPPTLQRLSGLLLSEFFDGTREEAICYLLHVVTVGCRITFGSLKADRQWRIAYPSEFIRYLLSQHVDSSMGLGRDQNLRNRIVFKDLS